MEQNERKLNRLTNFDYSRNGLYFITICTKDRIRYLSDIRDVGNAALGVPIIKLTEYGEIVDNNIKKINDIYRYVAVTKYVIMPDHIHMILSLDVINELPQIIRTLKQNFTKLIPTEYYPTEIS